MRKPKKPTAANRKALETIIVKLEVLQQRLPREYGGPELSQPKSDLIRVLNNWR